MGNHRKKSSLKSFALGSIAGGLLGGAATLLFAPKPGKKIRKRLAKTYNRVSKEAHDLMESLCDTSIELADKAKEISEDAQAAARCCKKRF
ncbi:MAG: YtxH domain-containing protein [Chlamydiales bacterium]|nr:YtxH domain-containing protein [Chlamydiales bacterium]